MELFVVLVAVWLESNGEQTSAATGAWGSRYPQGSARHRAASESHESPCRKRTLRSGASRWGGGMMRVLSLALLGLTLGASGPSKVEWTVDIEEAQSRADKEGRVILLALGIVGEGRSETHVAELYSNKKLADHFDESVNLVAWSFGADEERDLPRFGEMEPADHLNNISVITERWLKPNSLGVIALPQHVWLSPKGEVILSCPWEIDAEEFGWCFDEALRRAEIEERPDPFKGAHPPRRLLLGEVYRVIEADELGRGLTTKELEVLLAYLKKGSPSARDRTSYLQILFTDDDDGAGFLTRQIGLWELAGPQIAPAIDGTFIFIGGVSPPRFLETLEQFSSHSRAGLRARIAVGYEQIGHSDGLAVVKKALKKEKDEEVRAEWVRALGACGRSNRSVSKSLVRLATKEKNDRVRRNAILALGHVLPEKGALKALMELAAEGEGDDRWAAVLALALGRAGCWESPEARDLIEGLKEGEDDEDVLKIIERSLRVLDGGNLFELQSSFALISESEHSRWRLFFRPVGEAPQDEKEE